jgi:hypothetical protein
MQGEMPKRPAEHCSGDGGGLFAAERVWGRATVIASIGFSIAEVIKTSGLYDPLVLVFGIASGIVLPKKRISVAVAILLGVVFLALMILMGMSSSYSADVLTNLLLLRESSELDRPILIAQGVAGYICLVAGLVGGMRLLVSMRRQQPR